MMIILILAGCGDEISFKRHINESQNVGKESTGKVTVTVLDVGQGDAIVVRDEFGNTALIDAGPPGAGKSIILPYLRAHNIRKLSAIIITHYHNDHIGGLNEILLGEDGVSGTEDDIIPEKGIFDRGGENEPEETMYQIYKQVTARYRKSVHTGDIIALGSYHLEVVAANAQIEGGAKIENQSFDENAASVAILLTHGAVKLFTAGDLTGGGGTPPYDTPDVETALGKRVGKVDILKVSHHGSHTSSNEEFLKEIDPDIALISVGDGNDFNHPHSDVIERLLAKVDTIYMTEGGTISSGDERIKICGNIEIESDGENFQIKTCF